MKLEEVKMKKIIFCLIILVSVSTIAYAQGEIPGRPGIYAMKSAIIAAGRYAEGDLCYAVYAEPVNNNGTIGGEIGKCSTRVVINNNKVVATCKFTDMSKFYEANAEVGEILDCHLQTEDMDYFGGTGHIIAAANHGDEPGGKVTLMCTFEFDD